MCCAQQSLYDIVNSNNIPGIVVIVTLKRKPLRTPDADSTSASETVITSKTKVSFFMTTELMTSCKISFWVLGDIHLQ